jgi:hypothetical protein
MKNGIYKKKNGLYEGRYHKGRDDDGHIIYGSVFGKTALEAKLKRDKSIRELGSSFVSKVNEKSTVVETCKSYLNVQRQRLKPSTIAKYESHISNYIQKHFGNVKTCKLTKEKVEILVNKCTDQNNDEKLAGNTVKSIVSFMRTALSKHISKDVFDVKIKIDPPKRSR